MKVAFYVDSQKGGLVSTFMNAYLQMFIFHAKFVNFTDPHVLVLNAPTEHVLLLFLMPRKLGKVV